MMSIIGNSSLIETLLLPEIPLCIIVQCDRDLAYMVLIFKVLHA